MDSNVAENINILAKFLGTRDIDVLNQEELFERYGIHQADVMVLFGGSIQYFFLGVFHCRLLKIV